jgi:hypothetical protein
MNRRYRLERVVSPVVTTLGHWPRDDVPARTMWLRGAPTTHDRRMSMYVDPWQPCVSDAARSRCHRAATKIKRPDRLLAIRPLTCTSW